jgi:hypothetical protein
LHVASLFDAILGAANTRHLDVCTTKRCGNCVAPNSGRCEKG